MRRVLIGSILILKKKSMIKELKNTRVLVTGAEGFIGSHLARLLFRLGAQVNVLVHPKSSLWRINDLLDKIKVWPVDLLDRQLLKNALFKSGPLKIYHLAANVDHGRSLNLFDSVFSDNVKSTLNLLRLSTKIKIDCFINTGTCEEYGINQAPFKESLRECPVSPYSLSKVCTTYISEMFYKSFGIQTVTLRPFLTYGPSQDSNMFIPSLIISCLKNKDFKMTEGRQTREFNYVGDIIEGFVKASITPRAIGEVINLGCGKEYRILEVARLIKRLTNAKIKLGVGALPFRKGEAMRFYSSPQKAKSILGWKAKIGLVEGLIKTINWYRQYYYNEEK